MKKRFSGILALALALAFATPAFAQQTLKLAYFADPSREAVLWAIKNGKVKSDKIKIDATPMQIAELVQTMPTKTFDVVETSPMAIPFGRARGLDLKIMGTGILPKEPAGGINIWVKKDSPIKTIEDLKGQRMAVYSLSSAADIIVRVALGEVHNLNVAVGRGDLQLVQMPVPAMPAALASGNVEAAILVHAQAFKAMQSGEFRVAVQAGLILKEKFGLVIPHSLFVGYDEKLKKDPETYREFLRLLKESMKYAVTHPDEVYPAVGKATNIEPGFFKTWFDEFNFFPIEMAEQDLKATDLLWEKARSLGILKGYEPAADVVWDGALRVNAAK